MSFESVILPLMAAVAIVVLLIWSDDECQSAKKYRERLKKREKEDE